MHSSTPLYHCASCQSQTATINNCPMSRCAMIKCSTCKYHMLLEYPGEDLDVNGVYAEWLAIAVRQMNKAAKKAEKGVEKAFL